MTKYDSSVNAYETLHTCDPQEKTSNPRKQEMLDAMIDSLQGCEVPASSVYLFSLEELAYAAAFAEAVAPMKQKYDHAHINDHYKEAPRQCIGRYGEIAVEGVIDREFCDYRVGHSSTMFNEPDLYPLLPVGVKTSEFPKPWLIDRKYADVKRGIAESGLSVAEYMQTLKTPRHPYPLIPQILVMVSPDKGHEKAVVFGLVPVSSLVKNADDHLVLNNSARIGKTGFNAWEAALPFHDWDSLMEAFRQAVYIDRALGYDVYSGLMHDPEREALITTRSNAVIGMDELGNPTMRDFGDPQVYSSADLCELRMPDSVVSRANEMVNAWTQEAGGCGGSIAYYESQRQALVDYNSAAFMIHMTNALRHDHDPFAADNQCCPDREAKAADETLYNIFKHTDFGEFFDRLGAMQEAAEQSNNSLLASYLGDDDRLIRIADQFREREMADDAQRRELLRSPDEEEHDADEIEPEADLGLEL